MSTKQLIRIGLMTTALLSMATQAVAQHGERGRGGNDGGGSQRESRGPGGGQGGGMNNPAPTMQAPVRTVAPPTRTVAPPMRTVQPVQSGNGGSYGANYGGRSTPPSRLSPPASRSPGDASVQRYVPRPGTPGVQQTPPLGAQPRQNWSGDQSRSGNDWRSGANRGGSGDQDRDRNGRPDWNNQSNGQNGGRDGNDRDRNQNSNRDRNDGNRNWSGNQNRGNQNRDWGDRSGGRDWRYQQRLNDGDRWNGFRRWDNNSWRRDNRYDWQDYRRGHGSLYRLPRYYAPVGWYGGYSSFSIGIYLNNVLFGMNYWIDDPYSYRLPPAYGPLRWVRYYNDALLVDIRDGYVVDVIHDFFW